MGGNTGTGQRYHVEAVQRMQDYIALHCADEVTLAGLAEAS